MSQLKSFSNLAAYKAAGEEIKKENGTVVSWIEDGSGVKVDYKNFVSIPFAAQVNDVLAWNIAEGKPCIIKASERNDRDTLTNNVFPIGIIILIEDNIATVAAFDQIDSVRWAQGHKIMLTDFKSGGGTFDLTINLKGTDVKGTVTYPAKATMQDVVDLIKAAGLSENLTFEINEDEKFITILHNFWNGGTSSATGDVTYSKLTPCRFQQDYVDNCLKQMGLSGLKDKVVTTQVCPRVNGISSYYAGCNWDKFYEYYSVSGNTPDKIVELTDANIVNKTAFENSEFCSKLREKYKTYEPYLQQNMAKYPSERGYLSHLNGKENTDILRQPMWTDADGAKKPAYPAAYEAYSYTPAGLPAGAAPLFGKGNWYLPSGREVYLMINGRTKQGNDFVNRILQGMKGKSLRYNSYLWASTQYGAGYAVFFNGNTGDLNTNPKFIQYSMRPVLAFNLNN